MEWSLTILHSCSVSWFLYIVDGFISLLIIRAIYDKLKTGVRSEDDKQMIDQRIDEITTNVRFCQYKSGDKNAARELRNLRTKAALDDPEMTRVLDVRSISLHQHTFKRWTDCFRPFLVRHMNNKHPPFLTLPGDNGKIKWPTKKFAYFFLIYKNFKRKSKYIFDLCQFSIFSILISRNRTFHSTPRWVFTRVFSRKL